MDPDDFKRSLTVKYYQKPHGRLREIEMESISKEDIDFFERNFIMVSMEDIGNDFTVYACHASDESEESEILVFARGRSCEETMSELRQKCEKEFL